MLKICVIVIFIAMFTVPALANESMDVQDIMDVKPELPFGGDFASMLFALVKWIAVACFVIGLFVTIAHGAISSAMDNAEMSERSQNNIFKIAKIIGLGAILFLFGTYIFSTYL